MTETNIPIRLKEARKKLNLNQIQIAADLNIQQKSISDIENGKIQNIPNAYICYFYKKGISLEWIYDGKGQMLLNKTEEKASETNKVPDEGLFKDLINSTYKNENIESQEKPGNIAQTDTAELFERLVESKDYNIRSLLAYIKSLENNLEYFKDILDKTLINKLLNSK